MLFRTAQHLYPAVKLIIMEGVSPQLDSWRSNDEVDTTIVFRAGQSELRGDTVWGLLIHTWWAPAAMHFERRQRGSMQ